MSPSLSSVSAMVARATCALVVIFQEPNEPKAVEPDVRRRFDHVDCTLLAVPRDQCVGADERLRANTHTVGDVAVTAEIGEFADSDVAVENDVGSQKGMIADPTTITDLATTPDHYVVSDY